MATVKDCIFCKIVRGEIACRKVYEDEDMLAFHDIAPQAPVHFMIIPKDHVESLAAVGPEHVWLRDRGRASYTHVSDEEAVAGFDALSRKEGILPALESSHAIGWLLKEAPGWDANDAPVIVNCSGRGDKDIQQVVAWKARRAGSPKA